MAALVATDRVAVRVTWRPPFIVVTLNRPHRRNAFDDTVIVLPLCLSVCDGILAFSVFLALSSPSKSVCL